MQNETRSSFLDTMLAPFRNGWRAIRNAKEENAEAVRLTDKFNTLAAAGKSVEQAPSLLDFIGENRAASEKQRDIYPKMVVPPVIVALVGCLAAGWAMATLAPLLVWGFVGVAGVAAIQVFQERDATLRAHDRLEKSAGDSVRAVLESADASSPQLPALAKRAEGLGISFTNASLEEAASPNKTQAPKSQPGLDCCKL